MEKEIKKEECWPIRDYTVTVTASMHYIDYGGGPVEPQDLEVNIKGMYEPGETMHLRMDFQFLNWLREKRFYFAGKCNICGKMSTEVMAIEEHYRNYHEEIYNAYVLAHRV